MKTLYNVGDMVKYSEPLNKIESELIFKVVNFNEVTNRVLCECQNLPGYETMKLINLLGIEHVEKI